MNLTSENITDISTDITKISSGMGSYISGDKIKLCSKGGETFTAGYDKDTGLFEFSVRDKDGNDITFK